MLLLVSKVVRGLPTARLKLAAFPLQNKVATWLDLGFFVVLFVGMERIDHTGLSRAGMTQD